MQNVKQTAEDTALVIVREFNAPRKLVFQAFSEAEHLKEWWGPAGFDMSVIKMDFRVGGNFFYKMASEKMTMWGRFTYKEIKKPELIEFVNSFSDENGGITRAPFPGFELWPLEILNNMSFTEKDGRTTLTFKAYPVNASEEEIEVFMKNKPSLNGGVKASFDKLVKVLAKMS